MQRVVFKSTLFGHGRSSPRFVSEIIRELFRPFLARSDFTLLQFTHAAPFSGGAWGTRSIWLYLVFKEYLSLD